MSARGYGTVQRLFHWVVTAGVFITIPVAIAMQSELFAEVAGRLYVTHKGLGVLLLLLVVLRLGWRLAFERTSAHEGLDARERWMARAGHVALYALLLGMGITGYIRTVAGGFPIELLDSLGIPPLIGRNDLLAERMSVAHVALGYALIAVIGAHIGAIAHHAWVLRDGVAGRMWPPVSPRANASVEEGDT